MKTARTADCLFGCMCLLAVECVVKSSRGGSLM